METNFDHFSKSAFSEFFCIFISRCILMIIFLLFYNCTIFTCDDKDLLYLTLNIKELFATKTFCCDLKTSTYFDRKKTTNQRGKRRHLLTTTTETTHTHFNILFKLRQNTLACFKNIFMCLRPKKTIRIHLSSLILA